MLTFKLFIVANPLTFNDDRHVELLFNVVYPLTFNDDNNVEAPEHNKLLKLVLLFINNVELVDNELRLLNIVVDVVFILDISKYD